jgi:hypothetical protein
MYLPFEGNILVIHPKDPTTDFLKDIYKDIPNSKITIISDPYYKYLSDLIFFDRAIILGHGTPNGLIGINIDPLLPILKKQHDNIYIWCNADKYVKRNNLKGMCTGMMCSEVVEANMYNIKANQFEVDSSNELFAKTIGKYIHLSSEECVSKVTKDYNADSDLIKFNRERIYYFK